MVAAVVVVVVVAFAFAAVVIIVVPVTIVVSFCCDDQDVYSRHSCLTPARLNTSPQVNLFQFPYAQRHLLHSP